MSIGAHRVIRKASDVAGFVGFMAAWAWVTAKDLAKYPVEALRILRGDR
ncbi:hypothetical protein [Sorangium sp. So ce388]